jgi:hypothetical protein
VNHSISSQLHGIKDNHSRGKVASYLEARTSAGAQLAVVSAYFTIYAYYALKDKLDGIRSLRFLSGEPRFTASLDPEKTDKKAFRIEDDGLELANRLAHRTQKCAHFLGKPDAQAYESGATFHSQAIPLARPLR